ncbi:MAG: hypothetical protein ACYCWW_07770 [Deltaproteobacteria bacterium]
MPMLSVLLLVAAQAAPPSASPTPPPTPAPPAPGVAPAAPAPPAVAKTPIERWDELWRRRDEPTSAKELQALADQFASDGDYDAMWRTARWYFWLADGSRGNQDEMVRLAKIGWAMGDRAKAKNPKGLAGMYWTSVCIGTYSEGVGIFKALTQGLEGKFRDPIDAVKAADPEHKDKDVDYVGPEISLGRYWFSLPWPKRSLTKSKAELKVAVTAAPQNLRAKLFDAETLLADDDVAGARAQLDAIAGGGTAYDPPEARRIKRRAEAFRAKHEKELH